MAERANEAQSREGAQSQQIARRSQEGGSVARQGRDPFMMMSPREFFRASPFALMRRMTQDFDRMFGGFGLGSSQGEPGMWMPAIEVDERDGNYIVRAELAGLKPEDVHVEVTDDALILKGERKSERTDEKGGMHRSERSYGEFYRSIPLPDGINTDQVKAKFENGVLEVTAPMPPQQQSKSRQIPIEGGTSERGSSERGSSQKSSQPEVTH